MPGLVGSSYACAAVTRPARLVAAVLALAAATMASGFWGVTYDDGYITYRYADRLAAGRGLTFDDHARVLGTSAPGYAVLLAALARAGAPLGLDVTDAGSLLFFAGVVALAALAAGTGAGGVAIPLLFGSLALVSRFLLELSGCETLLATLGALLAVRLGALDGRPIAAGLAGAAAVSMRADAGLVLVAVAIVMWRQSGAWLGRAPGAGVLPRRFLAAAALPIGAGLALLAAYYGEIVPNTLAGKRSELALATLPYGRAQWEWLERAYGARGAVWLLVLALVGLGLGRRRLARIAPAVAAVALWLALHELFYRAVGVPFSPWYHVGTFLALLAAAAIGCWELGDRLLGRLLPGAAPAPRAAAAALLALPLALPSMTFAAASWGEPPDPRVRIYRDVAVAADACAGDGAIVAVEIGALGYHTRRAVIDLVGLVDRELLEAKARGGLAEAALARRPAFVVDHPVFRAPYLDPLFEHQEMRREFRLLGVFHRPEYPTAVRLWARAGVCETAPPLPP